MTFANAAMLLGLIAVIVPPLLHIVRRQSYDNVDWAAMQFLTASRRTKRKLFLEQFWLLLLRILVVVFIVVSFSAPRTSVHRSTTGPRDIVILIDGSTSMGLRHNGRSAAESAREWAENAIRQLSPDDRVAIFQVKSRVVPVVDRLTSDQDQARAALELLGPPLGPADWPQAIQFAMELLRNTRGTQDIIVLSDGQKYGWMDESTRPRWQGIRASGDSDVSAARIWVHDVTATWPRQVNNVSLDPIVSTRAVATTGRDLTFRITLRLSGPAALPGEPVRIRVDGTAAGQIAVLTTDPAATTIPLSFHQRLSSGSHLLTLTLPADDLPGDNRQDFALEVLPVLPVLIVDGSPDATGAAVFLHDALAPAGEASPAFAVRRVRLAEFAPEMLLPRGQGQAPPRVLVLSNIEKPTAVLRDAVEGYLNAGGSVLVALGERTDAGAWNRVVFRGGRGFLPARILAPAGDIAEIENAPRLQPDSVPHPAMELFREPLPGGVHTAYFPRRWRLDTDAGINGMTGTPVAKLSNGEPCLVERTFGRGRVIQASIPLDNFWRTNLTRLPDFVRLAHELTYYLAGVRAGERNINSGQPIVVTPVPDEAPGPVGVRFPDGSNQMMPVAAWPLVIERTTDPGPYTLTTPAGRTIYYAVRGDPRESDLTKWDDADLVAFRGAVAGVEFIENAGQITASHETREMPFELWWLVLVGAILLLVGELWYTQRLTKRGEHHLPD